MYEKPETPPQWSVHADITISHSAPNEPPPVTTTHAEQSGNGLRMVYTWTTQPPTTEAENIRTSVPSTTTFPSDQANRPSNQSYGFQRGGMTFTSVPPRQQTNVYEPPPHLGVNVQDSGYNSELLSPSSCGQGSYARRTIIPYNRRCRSTCSIILSTAINTDGHNVKCDTTAVAQPSTYHHCGRTQSLRCQTPTIKPDRRDSYYGCGDPWCYHAEDFSNRRCSPVLESCEECSGSNQSGSSKRTSRANTFTTHFCTRVPERNRSSPPSSTSDFKSKDMASQTVETQEKSTSPLEYVRSPFELPKDDKKSDTDSGKKKTRKLSDRRRSSTLNSRRNSDSNTLSPSSVADADKIRSSKRITRSPAMVRGRSPLVEKKNSDRDPTKKQRTVHIDVYCTGSDCESDSSSTDSEEGTQSSPQTVFESEKVRVSHRRAGTSELPYSLSNYLKNTNASKNIPNEQCRAKMLEDKRNSDSDEDVSTAYPSALSSYSHIHDLESSMSSVPASWSAMSTSSCTVPDGYDSVLATSCKDTVSDFESLVQRKFNLVPDESEYFIPRRLQSAQTSRTSTAGSLLPSDSFDYDDSADRERIKHMEQLWIGDPEQKTWKSPSSERKFLLQQEKMKEYLNKRTKEKQNEKQKDKESETESTEDDSEQGWSFVRNTDDGKSTLKRDVTVRRASREAEEPVEKKNGNEEIRTKVDSRKINDNIPSVTDAKINTQGTPVNIANDSKDCTPVKMNSVTKNPQDNGQFVVKPSASCTSISQTRRVNPVLRTPFTLVAGQYSEPLSLAQKFGTVIKAIRKPGHHIGPAKNPGCLCDHCRAYFQETTARNRTRSVGDHPIDIPDTWKPVTKSRLLDKTITSDF